VRKKEKDGGREKGTERERSGDQKVHFHPYGIELMSSNFAVLVGHFPTLFLLTEAQSNDAFLGCGGHKRAVLSKDAAKA
jgi:hypothetical protein